jgi:CheY-specific phosphatase CheX
MNSTPDPRAKFKLPPPLPNVKKIADLVKGRETASMEEIIRIIDADRLVTQRLISTAYPRMAAREGATVEMATARLGVNHVIFLIIGDLLKEAVIQTFEMMVSVSLELDDPSLLPLADQQRLTGSVKFTGKTSGQVTLAFSPYLSLLVTARLMGGNLEDHYSPDVIHDAVGELVNIVTGNLQSRLQDAGMPSEVGLPDVRYLSMLPKNTIAGGNSECFFFRQGMHNLGVNLSIAPFSS